ncbi:hypothetical protein H8356DRAFT_1328948 [Neocallimastix lanati (nom. inval.)]|nr:hypothetical protein H8356DRAFT_1328948 [Neocallimastix sp. JGI-2020a]
MKKAHKCFEKSASYNIITTTLLIVYIIIAEKVFCEFNHYYPRSASYYGKILLSTGWPLSNDHITIFVHNTFILKLKDWCELKLKEKN